MPAWSSVRYARAALALLALAAGAASARAQAPSAPIAQAPSAPIAQAPSAPPAQPPAVPLRPVTVTAPSEPAQPPATASEGRVDGAALLARPVYRTGQLLEAVPGLAVTQHSGEGKANQYVLRGFNLDHGTDLAVWVDGMPVNMRTHGHGQGYADLGFVIPELLDGLRFRKGPYFADEGDFSAAGAARLSLVDRLDRDLVVLSGGTLGHARGLQAGSVAAGAGTLLHAIEVVHHDGPWRRGDDLQKLNAVLRWSEGSALDGLSLTAMAYGGRWNATDQVPRRALDQGLIGRRDAIDPTDGGSAQRVSLSGDWRRPVGDGQLRVGAYGIASQLRLYNDFTYFLADPVNGDQFRQTDRRLVVGGQAAWSTLGDWRGREVESEIGIQTRTDAIRVGLGTTMARAPLATVRDDHVLETSGALYGQTSVRWTDWLRGTAGLRGDLFYADVDGDKRLNSGTALAFQPSPKLSFVLGPWADTELFAGAGRGFHSNDARGATIRVDPRDPASPQPRVPLLVSAVGSEVGVRTRPLPGFETSLALFRLDFDSELLFQGDAGTTEASRPSRRTGIEWSNRWQALPWLALDADLALSRARFTNPDPAGSRIPGSVATVVGAGATVDGIGPWYGALRLRHVGPRALVEDGSVRSRGSTLVDLRAGVRLTDQVSTQLELFNLFDSRASQIDYFYTSRLRGEPAGGVPDIHSHPAEPLSARLSLIARF